MLTDKHTNNFNQKHMSLYVPTFVPENRPWDRVWCTFWWMVGTQWGFHNKYNFNFKDYAQIAPDQVGGDHLTYRFNEHCGDYIKIGWKNHYEGWVQFENTDWEFEEWFVEDPLYQRIWIHLYNAVFTGNKPRKDLFIDHLKPGVNLFTDTGWFYNDYAFFAKRGKRISRRSDYVPRYLRKVSQGQTNPFKGKIKDTDA